MTKTSYHIGGRFTRETFGFQAFLCVFEGRIRQRITVSCAHVFIGVHAQLAGGSRGGRGEGHAGMIGVWGARRRVRPTERGRFFGKTPVFRQIFRVLGAMIIFGGLLALATLRTLYKRIHSRGNRRLSDGLYLFRTFRRLLSALRSNIKTDAS